VTRELGLFVSTLAALRSKDPARIPATCAKLAREPDGPPKEGQFFALSRAFLEMSREP
jgi:hypothetical protein